LSGNDHPVWCVREFCTAYGVEMDQEYHRSEPIIIEIDDEDASVYIHRGASEDGSLEYIEIAELELPSVDPWYLHSPRKRYEAEISMSLDLADKVHAAIGSLCVA
jgi:hypothetical protein